MRKRHEYDMNRVEKYFGRKSILNWATTEKNIWHFMSHARYKVQLIYIYIFFTIPRYRVTFFREKFEQISTSPHKLNFSPEIKFPFHRNYFVIYGTLGLFCVYPMMKGVTKMGSACQKSRCRMYIFMSDVIL